MVPLAAALAAGLLATGCGGAVSSAIKSLAPSASVPSVSLPSRSPRETQAAEPSAQEPATSAAAESPAASSGSGSNLIWLWIVLGALVLIGIIVLVARSGRRGPKPAEVWQARAVDAYAKGSALHDAMQMAEAPGALVAQDAAARWADIQRRADDLGQALYAMREAAPDEDKRMRTADVLAALQSVRSVMAAERGTDVTRVPPPEMVRSRLMAFGASLQGLRAPDDGMPY
ncbi:MAG TPA: hypothetical protein VFJ07_16280 [Streptosporangiaceae bacterium]|nr:hypothetical protein [Streptosporangiaceae bacterium]